LSESLLVSRCHDPLIQPQADHFSSPPQFIFRNEPGDAYLAAVSKFILNAYDFGDATAPETSAATDNMPETRERATSVSGPHNAPYLSGLFEKDGWA
jgi:hypothetical protein